MIENAFTKPRIWLGSRFNNYRWFKFKYDDEDRVLKTKAAYKKHHGFNILTCGRLLIHKLTKVMTVIPFPLSLLLVDYPI